MKEMKFKVWDKEEKRWFAPTYAAYKRELEKLLLTPDGELMLRTFKGFIHESVFLDRFEKVWYTGLKDKNGKEIFERDIVERNGIKYQIVFEIGSFMLANTDEENTDMYKEFDDCWNDHVYPLAQLYWNNNGEENYIHDLEVIGNIHENPELLEVSG